MSLPERSASRSYLGDVEGESSAVMTTAFGNGALVMELGIFTALALEPSAFRLSVSSVGPVVAGFEGPAKELDDVAAGVDFVGELETDRRRLALDLTLEIFRVLSGLADDFGAGDELGLGGGVDTDFDRVLIPAEDWVIPFVRGGLATVPDSRTLVLLNELVLEGVNR